MTPSKEVSMAAFCDKLRESVSGFDADWIEEFIDRLQQQLREKQAEIEMYQQKGTLSHGMNCPGNVLGEEDVCTCGLGWRSILQTEQTMHAAWRKRAEEAERQLAASQREVDQLRGRTFFVSCPWCFEKLEQRALFAQIHHVVECGDQIKADSDRLQAENAVLQQENERLKQEATDDLLAFSHANEIIEKYEQTVTEERALLRELAEALKEAEDRLNWIADSGDCSMSEDSVVECRAVRDDLRAALARAEEVLK